MKLLALGREGQVARCLAEEAGKRSGVTLSCFGRPDLDLFKPGSVTALIARVRPDAVINAAAFTAVDLAESEQDAAFRINAEAAGEAARAAADIDSRFVHLSTDYVFDGRKAGAYVETDEPNPLNVYGRSKLAGEEQVRSADPRHLILRTSWVYSAFGRNFVSSIMRAAAEGRELKVVDDQRGCPTSAHELAAAILEATTKLLSGEMEVGQTFHVAGSGEASWFEFARDIIAHCRTLGLPARDVLPISAADWPTPAARPVNSVMNCGQIAEAIGLELPHWRDALKPVVERLASHAGLGLSAA